MIKKTFSCILPAKYRRNGQLLTVFAGLLLILCSLNMMASPREESPQQTLKITGTVTDQENSPLAGVYIVIEGTKAGTITDIDGKYSIEIASADASLVFSFIGFLSQTVPVAGKTVIDITLAADVKALDEVVVIGYGTQRKEAVTGSVASLKGDVIQEVPSSNFTQALQGRVSGVEMSQTSTKPGASMQIRIRGTRSLSASNDPLVVLDGIPFAGSIGDISPSDIKSIDILKDASSTAIYGSRGANGVILITTNKGLKGQKALVSYNGYYGMKKVFAPFPMMSGPEFVKLRAAANQYTNSIDEADDVDTDWQGQFYRTAATENHDLSVSGGTEQGSYNFGVGYNLDQAVIPTQQYKRFSLRGSLDQGVGKSFRFSFKTNNNYSIKEGNQIGMYNVLSSSPIADPYNADGTLKRTIWSSTDEYWVMNKDVINDAKDKWLSETRAFGTYNNLSGEVKIPGVEGLMYRANIGIDLRVSNDGSYTGRGINSTNSENVSTASISNTLTTHWIIENTLNYDRTFAQKHQVNFVALYSAEQTKYNKSTVSAKDIPADAFQFYNLGRAAGDITVDPGEDSQGNPYQDYQLSGLMSWMGRLMYSFDNRYMLSVAVRSDGSSRLAEGHKWHTYPAVSAGWNIKNESFMENITALNSLKLRVGFGQTSNQSVDPYATLGRLSTRAYNFGDDTYSTGYYVSELPNPALGWEYSSTSNFGLDFALLNNRLSGTVEYYVTNTKDILLKVGLPSTSGVSQYWANIGEMQNKGWEISLNGVILDNFNGFTWEAGINVYGNRNELTALTSGTNEDLTNYWFVGHSINVIYDYEKIGLWQEDDEYRDILEPGGNVGQIKVKYTGDYNDDGSPTRAINGDDRKIIDLDPDFQGGFNTRVAYKGLDLSIIGTFRKGGILNSTLYGSAGYLNMLNGRRGNVKVDYWTTENTGAKYPKPGGVGGDNPEYGSTLGYFDASYLKIRTITLGYNVTQKLTQRIGIYKLRVYFTAQNPFVMFSPYNKESGMDPETNSYGNENASVPYGKELRRLLTVGYNTPSTRNYLVGINLTF
jgi:TonB-dependent starch-binding outer membrane protein SusC